jgi:replication factor A1
MSSEAEGEKQPTAAVNVKVESLDPESRQVNVTVKVVSKGEARETVSRRDGSTHKVVDALVGDETGAVYLTLWDDNIEKVNEGDTINVKNGYVTLFRGSMRLNIGRYGSLETGAPPIENVNADNNLSNKEFPMPERRRYPSFRPRYRDEGGGGYGDRGRGRGYGDGRGRSRGRY